MCPGSGVFQWARDLRETTRVAGRTIFIAGNTDFYRVMLGEFLVKSGLTAVKADEVPEAIETIQKSVGDLGLLIVNLSDPDFDGLSLLGQLKEKKLSDKFPIWVIENLFSRTDVAVLKGLHVKGILDKSVTPEEIVTKINSIIFGQKGEARKNPRIPIFIPVEYQVDGKISSAYISSISPGGLFIQTDRPPYLGKEINVKFKLPKRPQVIEGHGVILYISPKHQKAMGTPRPPGMGIRFKDLDETAKTLIGAYIETFGKKKVDDYQVIFGIT